VRFSRTRLSTPFTGGRTPNDRGRGSAADRYAHGTFSLTKGTVAYKGHTLKGTLGGPVKHSVYTFTYKAVYR
jgi:hypothetical protein